MCLNVNSEFLRIPCYKILGIALLQPYLYFTTEVCCMTPGRGKGAKSTPYSYSSWEMLVQFSLNLVGTLPTIRNFKKYWNYFARSRRGGGDGVILLSFPFPWSLNRVNLDCGKEMFLTEIIIEKLVLLWEKIWWSSELWKKMRIRLHDLF